MKHQKPYDFRKDLCRAHKRIYGVSKTATVEELELKDGISICIGEMAPVARLAAEDFADYLKTAFGIRAVLQEAAADITAVIAPEELSAAKGYMGRKTIISDAGIVIQANDERGIAQAFYALEDRMNRRRAPYLEKGVTEQKPVFSPRMIHSGYGPDDYPDEYLKVCAHHGYDAVLVFVKEGSCSAYGNHDLNDLVRRAAYYGIDVYAYSKMRNFVHPLDEGAKECYSQVYGGLFRDVPGLKGIVFVGESADFPSRDPHVCHQSIGEDGLPAGKPRTGWYPCYDYIDWMKLVRDSIHEVKPQAEMIFWSYNFGYAPEAERIKFVERIPEGVTLLVTFNMCEPLEYRRGRTFVRDYSLTLPRPSQVFLQEAEAAKRRNIRLYSMVNTAGRTWDFGVAPYEPFPWQWHILHENIMNAHQQFGLCGLMESHHFGFTPSFISLQAKEAFTVNGMGFAEYLRNWAENLAGDYAETLLEAMELVNASIHHYIPSNENQYGPYRIGPAYPFCLMQSYKMPKKPDSMWGMAICNTEILHKDGRTFAPYSLRRLDELEEHTLARELTKQGLKCLKTIPNKSAELKKLINLVEFLYRCHVTAVNFKEFAILKEKLMVADSTKKIESLATRIQRVGLREVENVKATIPLVRKDSHLGYEPSMSYVCDEESLNWKLKQMDYMLQRELPAYKGNIYGKDKSL